MGIQAFFFCAGLRGAGECAAIRQRVQTGTDAILPRVLPDHASGTWSQGDEPSVNGGWIVWQQDRDPHESLFSRADSPATSVYCYGHLRGAHTADAAAQILRTWEEHGESAVREMNGLFGAVVVEKASGRVRLVSDFAGTRALFYARAGTRFLVASHDLLLAACGVIPLEWSQSTAASLCWIGWPVRGQSLLRGVTTSTAYAPVVWQNGELTATRPPVSFGRVGTMKPETPAALIRTMQDALREELAATSGTVAHDLTAGIDSRAALGVSLSVLPPERLHAHTLHDDGCDALWACRIAAKTGVAYDPVWPSVTPEAYEKRLTEFAFRMNGNFDPGVCVFAPEDVYQSAYSRKIWGAGGEIFRGYWYPSREPDALAACTMGEIPERLYRRMQELASHQSAALKDLWRDPQIPGMVEQDFRRAIADVCSFTTSAPTACDLFYIWERMGCWWGARAGQRDNARQTTVSAFLQPDLIFRYLREVPPAIRADYYLQKLLLKRLLPACDHWPVNGSWPPELLGPSTWLRRQLRKVWHKAPWHRLVVGNRLWNLRPSAAPHAPDLSWLSRHVREQLLSPNGFAAELFEPRGLEQTLRTQEEQHGASTVPQFARFLYAMDCWRGLAEAAHRHAKAV